MLTAQHENLVRKGENLVFCEHCSRIHYWQESEALEGTAVATKRRRRRVCKRVKEPYVFGKAGNRCRHSRERKVWTSQERIPVKDWGPKATESVTENIPLALHSPDRLKMLASGVGRTCRNAGCYKPYLKQEQRTKPCSPQESL